MIHSQHGKVLRTIFIINHWYKTKTERKSLVDDIGYGTSHEVDVAGLREVHNEDDVEDIVSNRWEGARKHWLEKLDSAFG